MKVSVLSLFVAASLLSCGWTKGSTAESFEAVYQSCFKLLDLNTQEMAQYFRKGAIPSDAPHALKCHSRCLMERLDHLRDGVYNATAAYSTLRSLDKYKDLDDDHLRKGIDACKNERGSDECDTAFRIATCFQITLQSYRLS